jgi:hypothetical protein
LNRQDHDIYIPSSGLLGFPRGDSRLQAWQGKMVEISWGEGFSENFREDI